MRREHLYGRDRRQRRFEIDLLEYERLKEEQLSRIGVRDNLVYAALAVFGGVAALSLSGGTMRYPLLLLLPPVCFVLGWTYVVNDQRVSAIGDYLRDHLAPRLSSDGVGVAFRWEVEHRTDPGRGRRKTFQLGADIFTFCLSGLVALVVYWVSASNPPELVLVISVAEVVPLVLLAVEIVRGCPVRRVV